jgi:hypothetical protein
MQRLAILLVTGVSLINVTIIIQMCPSLAADMTINKCKTNNNYACMKCDNHRGAIGHPISVSGGNKFRVWQSHNKLELPRMQKIMEQTIGLTELNMLSC